VDLTNKLSIAVVCFIQNPKAQFTTAIDAPLFEKKPEHGTDADDV
jgi:hypothetical protein